MFAFGNIVDGTEQTAYLPFRIFKKPGMDLDPQDLAGFGHISEFCPKGFMVVHLIHGHKCLMTKTGIRIYIQVDMGTDGLCHGIAGHLGPERIEKDQSTFFVQLEDDLIDVFYNRSVFLFVFSGLCIETGTGDSDINMVTQRRHDLEIRSTQGYTLSTFYIECASNPILIEQWKANFRYNTLYGA